MDRSGEQPGSSDEEDATGATEIINMGAEIVGGVATAAAGLVVAEPAGALGVAAGAPLVIRALRWAGHEVRERVLSHREQVRAGGALASAALELQKLLEQGEELRNDGFFQDDVSPGRTAAEEILEGVLVTAERSYEERKVPYLGKLYAGIAVDASIDPAAANYLLAVGASLTWMQYVTLNVIAQNFDGRLQLRESMFPEEGQSTDMVALAHQMLDLAQRGFLLQKRPGQEQSELILDAPHIVPAYLKIQGFGFQFWRLAQLSDMPQSDWMPVARMLGSSRQKPKVAP